MNSPLLSFQLWYFWIPPFKPRSGIYWYSISIKVSKNNLNIFWRWHWMVALKSDGNIFLFHKIILVQLNATDDLIAPTCDLIWMLIISDIGSSSRISCNNRLYKTYVDAIRHDINSKCINKVHVSLPCYFVVRLSSHKLHFYLLFPIIKFVKIYHSITKT